MATYTLIAEKRDSELKAKKVRANGFVPAVVYGQHIDTISIQIKQDKATKFLLAHSVGAKVLLEIDGEEQLAIFKEFKRAASNFKINHMDFHALTSGEKVKITVPINFVNKDSIDRETVLQEQLSVLEISTLPKFLVDHVDIDVSKYSLGDSVHVSDLDIMKDENIEVLSPEDAMLFTISHAAKFTEEVPETDGEAVDAGETEQVEATEE